MNVNIGVKHHEFLNASTEVSTSVEMVVSSNYGLINIEVSGTSTSFSIVFEGKGIGEEWYQIPVVNIQTMGVASTIQTKSIYQLNLTGLTKIRTNLTNIENGNITTKGRVVNFGIMNGVSSSGYGN